MLIQHYINVPQGCFDVVSTLCNVILTSSSDVLSALCNVETPTSDFVSFSTSDQRYLNVDLQRWSDVEMLPRIFPESFLCMQIRLELFSPEIISALENKDLLSHFRVYGTNASSAQMDGQIRTDAPLYTSLLYLEILLFDVAT